MSRRKGLSHEEKRSKMLELFYEKKDFFMLKELEKMAPKEKGVISQAVKDVVQSLVDDNLVDTDKIGTCVYFWAFPSKASGQLTKRKSDLQSQLSEAETKLAEVQEKLLAAQAGRTESSERTAAMAALQEAKERNASLLQELKQYADNDPEALNQMQQETKVAVEAANRWTGNLFCVKSWCKNKFLIEEDTINKQFNIPEDLDYIEE